MCSLQSASAICFISDGNLVVIERTVGAALRGRPCVELIMFAKLEIVVFESVEFDTGAATEGRPYSTFDRA